MIDKLTGHIIISDTIRIKHNDLRQDIISYSIGKSNELRDFGNGWSWLTENYVFIDDKYFVIQFGFHENRLKEMKFCVSDAKSDLYKSWEDWSVENNLADLEKYEKWLKNELGLQRVFEWGTVWTSFDSKGGGSSIGIRYK